MKPQSGIPATAFRLLAAAAFATTLASARAQTANDEPPPAQEKEHPADKRIAPSYGPETLRATQDAAQRYADIATSGGWPRLSKSLSHSAHGKPVLELRRRLAIEGYLARDASDDPQWGDDLTDALKRFQANTGLEKTGEVSRATLRALNVPPAARARALAATAARLSKMRFRFGDRYVSVNIPGSSVEAVENDEALGHYDAIVGGKRDRSPQITAKIVAIDINPTWTVPASIIRKELMPKLKRNPRSLAQQNIRVLDGRGREIETSKLRGFSAARAASFTFRQDPGPRNALGSLRLDMPNKDAVFMHDTPQKHLFDREYRFLSHGCVRVEGVYDLAAWLLDQNDQKWDEAALRDQVDEGRTEKIKLRHPTPVAWVYMTGWATQDGPAHFRRDIYDLDKGAKLPPQRREGGVASR